MHALDHRSIVLIVVGTVVLTIGCRGSRPFSRFVQVSQEPQLGSAEIEAPPQRLATSKPRVDASPSGPTGLASHDRRLSASPDRRAPSTDHASSAGNTPSKNNATTASLSDRRPAAKGKPAGGRVTDSSRSGIQATAASQKTAASQVRSPDVGETDSEVDPALAAALKNVPPQYHEQFKRQLAAYKRHQQKASSSPAPQRTAPQRTAQPNAPESKLATNALPELPVAGQSKSQAPPTRIATDRESAAAVASLTDKEVLETSDVAVRGDLTDVKTTDLATTDVQAIPEVIDGGESKVETASASRGDSDDLMVATAALDPTETNRSSSKSVPSRPVASAEDLYATLLEQLSKSTEGESEAERTSRLIRQRLMMVLAGNPDAAVKEFSGMPEAEQEYLRHQLLGLWTMIDPEGHPVPSHRFTTALPQIRKAARFAAAATDSLEVRSLAFCTEIESYGQIKPFDGNRFDAGQQVILYCEIENFTAKQTAGGFETHLQGSYDIFDADNKKVVSQLLPADKQVSANYLRDYFIAYQMHLPQQLSPGTYRLQLTMEDVNKKKYGQASIPLEIAE